MNAERHLNIEYSFSRRRYGKAQFYTWLHYRAIGDRDWQTYGDPWPKVRLNRVELSAALADITTQIESGKVAS